MEIECQDTRRNQQNGCDLPALHATPKGNVYIAWSSTENGKTDVFLRALENKKMANIVQVSESKDTAVLPTIDVVNSATLHVAWMDDSSGEFEIYHRKIQVSQQNSKSVN